MCWLGCDNTKGFELGLRPVMVLFILLTTERLYRAMNDQGGITFVRSTSFTTGENQWPIRHKIIRPIPWP